MPQGVQMHEILSNQKKTSKIRRTPLKIRRSFEKCRRSLKSPLLKCLSSAQFVSTRGQNEVSFFLYFFVTP